MIDIPLITPALIQATSSSVPKGQLLPSLNAVWLCPGTRSAYFDYAAHGRGGPRLRVDDNRTRVAGVFIDVSVRDRVEGSSDRDEFERFAAKVSPSLLRSAYLLTRDRGHAEDLLQMTLWRVARRWHAIEGAPEGYARIQGAGHSLA